MFSPIGYLSGFQLFENPYLLIFEEIWTRKQIRKFKNRRWNKKYRKKYCTKISSPDPKVVIDNVNNRIYGHPATLQQLKEQLQKQEIRSHSKGAESFLTSPHTVQFINPGFSQTLSNCLS